MATQIFVNLPVKSLDRSMEFFSKLDFKFNPQFTDEKAACMIVSDTIYIMLLKETFFGNFTKKSIVDATKMTESIICLSRDSRQQVDEIVNNAVHAGGKTPGNPQDYGNMYGWGFEDLDGHLWEFMFMEQTA